MSEANALDRITAYMVENRINTALEAELNQKLAVEAIIVENDEDNPNMVNRPDDVELHTNSNAKVEEEGISATQMLDCIYDDEPFGFEKDPQISTKRMQAQDPLEEVDLRDGEVKRPTYISAKIDPSLRMRWFACLRSSKIVLLGIIMRCQD